MSLIEKIMRKITRMFDCENENPEKELLIVLAIFGAFMIEQAIATWYQYGIIGQKSLDGKSLEEGKIVEHVEIKDTEARRRAIDRVNAAYESEDYELCDTLLDRYWKKFGYRNVGQFEDACTDARIFGRGIG